jgi:large subunit ribosomal protein L18
MPSQKVEARLKRKRHIRKQLHGTAERPRLSVFRSTNHIYAQVIDDVSKKTIAHASDLEEAIIKATEGKKKLERAQAVGEAIAKRCLEKKVEAVVFDRNGFIYHGRVSAVADAARKAGLKF